MKNPIARTPGGLITQSTNAIAGLQTYGTPLNITTVTAASFNTVLTAYTAGQNTCNTAKTTMALRHEAVRDAIAEARPVVMLAREVLKPQLGKEYSSAWVQAGFVQSLAVPRKPEKLLPLLSGLAAYFTAHPDHGNEALDIDAERMTTLLNKITAAGVAVNTQKFTLAEAMALRTQKGNELHDMLRKLLKELSLRMGPMDDRYLAFGFKKPGAPATPDVPKNLTAVLVGTNAIAMKWSPAARATHYRVWKKTVDVDAEFVPVGNPADLDHTIEGLEANSMVEVAVSAVNAGGE
ncbi:MAG: fibronectin type III domain-containing protein, partial [Limisphaerales bacterium]